MKLFLALLLAIPVHADDELYQNSLGCFFQDEILRNTILTEVSQWAIESELISEVDGDFFNQYIGMEGYIANCRILRERYEDLHNVPLAVDSYRFPPYSEVNELLLFNNEYTLHLKTQQIININRRDEYDVLIKESMRLESIWRAVSESRQEWQSNWQRRYNLKFVLDAIGPADYYAGKLPPHVPVWRFSNLD